MLGYFWDQILLGYRFVPGGGSDLPPRSDPPLVQNDNKAKFAQLDDEITLVQMNLVTQQNLLGWTMKLLTSWTSGMSTSPCAMPGASYAHDWPLRPALRGSLHAGTGAPFSDVHFAIANKFQPDWQKPKSGQSEKACEKLASYSRARNSNGSRIGSWTTRVWTTLEKRKAAESDGL